MRIDSSAMMAQSNATASASGLLSKIYEKLASGKRINRASDDAAGIAVAKELESQARGLKQSQSNIGDAMSALNIADGATGEIQSMLQRQRDLALQASNDTLTNEQRSYLDKEYQALNAEIDRVAGSTQFNRQQLLNGSSPLSDGTGRIQVGNQAGDQLQLDRVNFTTAAIGAGGSIATAADASGSVSRLDRAMQSVNSGRSTLGAEYNRFGSAASVASTSEINATSSQSLIEDLDYAQGIMEQSRAELLQQSSISAQGIFLSISRNSLLGLLD